MLNIKTKNKTNKQTKAISDLEIFQHLLSLIYTKSDLPKNYVSS